MTFFWYDLETFGLNSQWDRIGQFAGIRTNTAFEPIGDPVVLYCRITPDYVPNVESCLVTGMVPQETMEKGVREFEFVGKIHKELAEPETCTLGYNSLSFDDEFIRNALYRNFFDPYAREYSRGNSRWDIIDLTRVVHDLRPDGITWPTKDDGRPSFRLGEVAAANGIIHDRAHEALSDVYATIGLAKLIRDRQPKLFKYVYQNRSKEAVRNHIDLHDKKPFLFTSPVYTSDRGCTAMVAPLAVDPSNNRKIFVYDLRIDPAPLLDMSIEELQHLVFTPRRDLPQDSPRIPIQGLRTNRCPVISPLSTLDDAAALRLGIDIKACQRNYQKLLAEPQITQKVTKVYSTKPPAAPEDVDLQLYSGGFFSDPDRDLFATIRESSPEHLVHAEYVFEDPRAKDMLWRFIGRNYPHAASPEFLERWKSFCASRILFPPTDDAVSLSDYKKKIIDRRGAPSVSVRELSILKKLEEYGDFLDQKILGFSEG
jgi:exodeoxyribonuclease I